MAGPDASGPWWSDGLNDPWRDPDAPAAVVRRVQPPAPPPAQDVAPAAPRVMGTRSLALVAGLAALLAGILGGGLGFAIAAAGRSPTVQLGARTTATPPQRASDSIAGLVEQVMPSVVTVTAQNQQGEAIGSGFVVSPDGYLMTNDHVIAGLAGQTATVTLNDGTNVSAKLIGSDPESDVAVLKVDQGNLTPLPFADSSALAVGDQVFAVGSPLALPGTVTAGIISALDRPLTTTAVGGVTRYYAAIQTDAAVNQGSSGGPLFDSAGRVVGINAVIKSVVGDSGEAGNIGIAFAIPINQAARVATEIISTGKAHRTVIGADLGVSSTTTSVSSVGVGGPGASVVSVHPDGPAAAAGLRAGDVITKIDDHPVADEGDAVAYIRSYDPGTRVMVSYRRGGVIQTADVTLVADAN